MTYVLGTMPENNDTTPRRDAAPLAGLLRGLRRLFDRRPEKDASHVDMARAFAAPVGAPLRAAASPIAEGCTDCGACVGLCAFLRETGTPGNAARALLADGPEGGGTPPDPYACSLCGLCRTICPTGLAPDAMYLEMRRQAAARGALNLAPYRPLLTYERIGRSAPFRLQAIPAGGETVFFPGCALPGTRPGTTMALFRLLSGLRPGLGLVLDCCTKPSHDLGLQDSFEASFLPLRERLLTAGVRRVLTACPNCHKVFTRYGDGLEIRSVWTELAASDLDFSTGDHSRDAVATGARPNEIVVHDPCPMRDEPDIRDAVRELAARTGLPVTGKRGGPASVRCCGEGGAVGFVRPELARTWGAIHLDRAKGRTTVTFCAGCTAHLRRSGLDAVHLGDLLAAPGASPDALPAPAAPPRTYLNRLLLKRSMRRLVRS